MRDVWHRADMTGSLRRALDALDAAPEVRSLSDEIAETSAALRWHQCLRRRTREARHAAALWSATSLADAAGLPGGEDLAHRVVSASAGDDARWATWRVQFRSLDYLGTLGGVPDHTPPGQVAAALARDGGHHDVVAPAAPGVARQVAASLPHASGLMAAEGPTLVRAALSWAHAVAAVRESWDTSPLHRAPPAALGAALARVTLVRSGLEPTGVAVLDDPAASAEGAAALAGYLSADWDASLAWCVAVGQMVRDGLVAGRVVCDEVVAGRRGVATTTGPH